MSDVGEFFPIRKKWAENENKMKVGLKMKIENTVVETV